MLDKAEAAEEEEEVGEEEEASTSEAASTPEKVVATPSWICPYLEYDWRRAFLGKGFQHAHKISRRVNFRLLDQPSDVTYADDHITVPLMALTEGGFKFPVKGMTALLLSRYKLTPFQVSVNTFRLLSCF